MRLRRVRRLIRCVALVLTAKYEAEIAISEPPTDGGPSPLSKFIPPLLQAIDDDNDFLEDKFQASICLGWLHWVLNEPRLAIVRFPKDMVTPLNQAAEKSSRSLQWVQTCACKGAYLRGAAAIPKLVLGWLIRNCL